MNLRWIKINNKKIKKLAGEIDLKEIKKTKK
jgi:hypothetical protein